MMVLGREDLVEVVMVSTFSPAVQNLETIKQPKHDAYEDTSTYNYRRALGGIE